MSSPFRFSAGRQRVSKPLALCSFWAMIESIWWTVVWMVAGFVLCFVLIAIADDNDDV